MLELKVAGYCHDCPYFEPTREEYELYYSEQLQAANTYIVCKNSEKCGHIAEYLKKFGKLDEECPVVKLKGELRNLQYIELEEGYDFMISVRDSSIKLYSYQDNELLMDSLGNAVKFVAKKRRRNE